jgi:hypothetical protein
MICFGHLVEGMVSCAFGGKLPEFKKGLPCTDKYPK